MTEERVLRDGEECEGGHGSGSDCFEKAMPLAPDIAIEPSRGLDPRERRQQTTAQERL